MPDLFPLERAGQAAITWRYWEKMVQAAKPEEQAEFRDQLLAAERDLRDAADRAEGATVARLERAVVAEVINLVALDDRFEGLDKDEDYFGNLADLRQQKVDDLIELARPLLAARAPAVAE